MPSSFARFFAVFFALLLGLTPLIAQPSSPLEAARAEITSVEAALKRPNQSDADLQALRQRLDPAKDLIRKFQGDSTPAVDAAKQLLIQLGPKPDDKSPPESEDIAKERAMRETDLRRLEEPMRLSAALLAQADQLTNDVSERRRALLAQTLFLRQYSLLQPGLWLGVVRDLPNDVTAFWMVTQEWGQRILSVLFTAQSFPVGLALLVCFVLYAGRARVLARIGTRNAQTDPSRFRKMLAAASIWIGGTIPAIIGSLLLYSALNTSGFVPPRLLPFVWAILSGLAWIASVRSLSDALFAPDDERWRLLPMGNETAAAIHSTLWNTVFLVAVLQSLDALAQAISAAMPLTVALRGTFLVLIALRIAHGLRSARTPDTVLKESDCLGEYIPIVSPFAAPLKLLCWLLVVTLLGASVLGFMAFGVFLVQQLKTLFVLGGVVWLAFLGIEEGIAALLAPNSRVALTVQTNTGLKRKTLEQVAVLSSGVLRFVLLLSAGLITLAPWGVESVDFAASLRAAFFGFKVGDITISLSAIVLAGTLFAVVWALIKVVQRWLNTTFLPATDLDVGLRNSIQTAFGYVGFVVAASFGSIVAWDRVWSAIDCQQFRLRPDFALGAPDSRQRLDHRR
jgi:potassium-dependent mechanosensitive channel